MIRSVLLGLIMVSIVAVSVFPSAWIAQEGQLRSSLALGSQSISGVYVGKPRVGLKDIPGFTGDSISILDVRYEGEYGTGPSDELAWSTGICSQSSFSYFGAQEPVKTYINDTRLSVRHQFFEGLVSGATEIGVGIPGSYLRNSFSFEGMRDFEIFAGILVAHAGADGFSTALDFGHYWRVGPAPNAFHLNYYAGQRFGNDWRVFGIFDYWIDLDGDALTNLTVFRDKDAYYRVRQIQDRFGFGLEQRWGDWNVGILYSAMFSGENVPYGSSVSIYTTTATFL